MGTWFTNPTSYRLANHPGQAIATTSYSSSSAFFSDIVARSFDAAQDDGTHPSHPALPHLVLLVFEAVMEVVCVSLPGYIIARQGLLDAEQQKFMANLNVMLFTPCLIFTKLASQLTADKLMELAVIPLIFIIQTLVSYMVATGVSKAFGFGKRPANFVTAMGVFGNSNSLPISLVISLSQTLKGLHWDKIPGDNDEEVAARGILYLLIFQQLGQLVRWSWGYHVLLAPASKYLGTPEGQNALLEDGRYRDEPDSPEALIPGLIDGSDDSPSTDNEDEFSGSDETFDSGERTPVNVSYVSPEQVQSPKTIYPTPSNGNHLSVVSDDRSSDNIISFPSIRSPPHNEERNIPSGIKGIIPYVLLKFRRGANFVAPRITQISEQAFNALPHPVRKALAKTYAVFYRFFAGLWEFMNPPLWAMLIAVVVASIPNLQRLFFQEGSFIANSVTRAVAQSGGVAVPLILVVLGANLARNTLPSASLSSDSEEAKIDTKLLVASLISRMVLPTMIMAPLLALFAKFVPVSILDDPIFVIVCFLLTGAPSALQLAQICQINDVYQGVMSKLLFHSYVVWILPSTLVLVMCALEVVEWAQR